MGIVKNQSFKNFVTTYLGFGIGAINVLLLYPHFLTDEYYGLITFVLSTAAIMMPILALGVHNTMVKFYSSFKTRNSVNSFLTLMLILPLAAIIPLSIIGYVCFDFIANTLSKENEIIKDYVWLILIAAICFTYFEVFYAWAKVQLQSVVGNLMKEVFHRLGIMLLFVSVYFNWISVESFLYGIIIIYIIRTFTMMVYAFTIRRPVIKFCKLKILPAILKYSLLIILAGSIGGIMLEIDKFMLGQYIDIENVAYYGVAIYIARVVGVPARAMYQITNPLTAKLLNANDKSNLKDLYKKSSLNLFIISGFVFLLIILNINELYQILEEQYRGGTLIVFLVGLTKLIENLIGNNNAILFNSNYYRMVLFFGFILALLAIILNMLLIPHFGINGAAYATFISIVIYNICKIVFVYVKFEMVPFTLNTLKISILLIVCFLVFYFWEFSFHPIVNIALKSLLITLLYFGISFKLNLSEDITKLLNTYIK